MRRQLAFVSTLLALALILVLPATTFASSYTYTVMSTTCTPDGGAHGFGHMYLKVKMTEYGNSGANKFTFSAEAQYHHRIYGTFTEWTSDTFTWTFPSNSGTNSYTRSWRYDPNGGYDWWRLKATLKVWHNGTLLASKVLLGTKC